MTKKNDLSQDEQFVLEKILSQCHMNFNATTSLSTTEIHLIQILSAWAESPCAYMIEKLFKKKSKIWVVCVADRGRKPNNNNKKI